MSKQDDNPELYIVTGIRKLKQLSSNSLFRVVIICLIVGSATIYGYAQDQAQQDKTAAAKTKNQTAQTTAPQESGTSSTDTQQAAVTAAKSKKSGNTAYRPNVCTKTPTPYPTDYRNDPSLPVGETRVAYQGQNGWVSKCTPDSEGQTIADVVNPPITKVVMVGTKQPATPPPAQGVSYQQAASNCAAAGATSNTSAFAPCMAAYGY